MPVHVARHINGRTLVDRDTLATLTGYAATTIRIYCRPDYYDTPTIASGQGHPTGRALYDQDTVLAQLAAIGCQPRPHMQGVPRAKRHGPAKRRRKR